MRNTFIDELVSLASTNENIALIVGDLGYGVVEPFADRFPDRFINAGVAEQNMTGLAAGMASEGYQVFTYSIANFPTFRCAEQIRNDIDYHKLPVTTVAVGGGLAYGNLGYSHHAIQDYALMRCMPNMLIAAPGDPMEVRACVRYLVANPQPSYLRLGKVGETCIHNFVPVVYPGKWLEIKPEVGVSRTILTTGAAVGLASSWIKNQIESNGLALHTLPLWGMSSKKDQAEEVSKWVDVLTVEDHLIDGGFGSWLMESLVKNRELISRVHVNGLSSKICGMVGSQETLVKASGLAQL